MLCIHPVLLQMACDKESCQGSPEPNLTFLNLKTWKHISGNQHVYQTKTGLRSYALRDPIRGINTAALP